MLPEHHKVLHPFFMKASPIALIFLSFASTAVFGQGGVVNSQIAESRVSQLAAMGANSTPIHGFDSRTSDLKGSPYLFDKWMKGNVTSRSGKNIDSLQINYDIMNHMVEIKVNKYVKAASEAEINGFSVADEYGQKRDFISVSSFQSPDEKLVW